MTVSREDSRMICWPNPDGVCLQGGCGYCNSCGELKKVADIEKFAELAGLTKDFQDGLKNDFFNAKVVKA